ncbi:DUF1194 domain-containing protein [Caldovatus aquaticus]|uniref:DUF1194 domain-containing protein n=1 Tax=Caldovatus aquaticus TaxID=2865671 RepID=A0ABS7F153_9PROT|nr:DUF1194 domain-containing protein [Caldovatus aquaticus]MBW8269243.1 DUF1194 domain-containing protein [Caldovatus aquaticus]
MLRRRAALLLPGAAALGAAAEAAAVDLLLVLALDASGSMDADEFRLQREGCAEALTHPATLAAVASRPRGAIAVAVVEWGSPGAPATVLGWRRVADAASAGALARELLAAPRSAQSYNAIGDAIAHAAALIAAAPFRAEERVIDVSGDGPDLRSLRPAPEARDAAVAAGITVNALAIELAPVTRLGLPLRVHYEREVIGGPGAFVMAIGDRRDFARALRAKLVREIAGGRAGADRAQT